MYEQHQVDYRDAINSAQSSYYSNIINTGDSNSRVLFSTVNKLTRRADTQASSSPELCNKYLRFFHDKTDKITNAIRTSPPIVAELPTLAPPAIGFSTFSTVSTAMVTKTVNEMKNTTCALDHLPTPLVKTCLPALVPSLTAIINTSLSTGIVPAELKHAAVTPVLKKTGANPDEMNNYRPISNLPFMAKLLERTASSQLKVHLTNQDLLEPFQSAYRARHSTETALVRVTNDLLLSADTKANSILILLDLSAAFDTVNHDILLDRLENLLGLSGLVLDWFRSYLSGRSEFVSMGSCKSESEGITQGVPQGSVLGPLLFCIYMLPLGLIIRKHGLSYHFYADDTQLYITLKNRTSAQAITILLNCLHDIKAWMQQSFLQLNCAKTEVILIGTNTTLSQLPNLTIKMDGVKVVPSSQIRNLGVIFDSNLTFESHVKNTTKVSFFHLRRIAKLRPFLSQSAAERLIHAFVASRLDYGNALLVGSTDKTINPMQYVQNCAARLLTHTSRREHITPVLFKLHWLRIRQRINFKVLVLTFQAIHATGPSYLTELITVKCPVRSLRSSSSISLVQPKPRLVTVGGRAFSHAAPELWNNLPAPVRDADSITTFKSLLKTHLFKQDYKDYC